jgi:hypothetical protein
MSGWQDSNLRPSAPKADALTGLRYTPIPYEGLQRLKENAELQNQKSSPVFLTASIYVSKLMCVIE